MVRTQCALLVAIGGFCCLADQYAAAYLFETPPWLQTPTPAPQSLTPPPIPRSPPSVVRVDSCLTSPGSPTLGYWRYHVERSGRHCWYQAAGPARRYHPAQSLPAVVPEPALAASPAPAYGLIPATPFLVPLPTTASPEPPWLQQEQTSVVPKTSPVVQNAEPSPPIEAPSPQPPHQLPPPDVIKELPALKIDHDSTRKFLLLPLMALFQIGIAALVWTIINKQERKRRYAGI